MRGPTRQSLAWTVLAVASVISFVACGDAADDTATDSIEPAGREWVLEELQGEPLAEDATITLFVDDGQLSGSGGCNRYIGAVDLDERSVTFDSEIAQTMMACPDEIMTLEESYLAALATVADWTATDDRLILLDTNGNEVAAFT